jgi:polyhydroxyalkanoate synthesis repressor PhaR
MDAVVIKKYANRRLYDTEGSAYVTLNQVADMIRGGRQVQVVDARTGEDVTAFILAQIIMERAREKNILMPSPLLHLIIRYGDNILEEFFEKYLEQVLKNYLAYKNAMDDQFKKWLDLGMDISQKTLGGFAPFQAIFDAARKDKEEKKN